MPVTLATWIVTIAFVYLAVGLAFAIPFVLVGVGKVDPVAAKGTWGFRLLILPGSVAFWPMLTLRWLRGTPRPVERNAHRDAARRTGGTGDDAPLAEGGP